MSGFPYLPNVDGLAPIAPNALAANILCTHHNSSLSPLDVEATRLFEFFRAVGPETRAASTALPSLTLDGHLLERWSLKLLAGAIASGHAQLGTDGKPHRGSVERPWVNALFGRTALPERCGLFFMTEIDEAVPRDPPRLNFSPFLHDGQVIGVLFDLNGIRFAFSMKPYRRAGNAILRALHRPSSLTFKNSRTGGQRSVRLRWRTSTAKSNVLLEVV